MAIDTPLDSARRAQHYALQQQRPKYDPVSAGRFEAPASMSMLGIRERPVEYVPNEKAKEFLKDFFIQTGLRLNVEPAEGSGSLQSGSGFGYYQPQAEKGGSLDPRQRTVYLDAKNPILHTLIHEGGHAQDPNLYEESVDEMTGRDKYYGTIVLDESAGDNLRRFMSMVGPMGRLRSETIAQKYVVDYLKSKGYSDEQIRSMESRGGDYGKYPYTYVDDAFRYREGIGPQNRATMPDANTIDRARNDRFVQDLGDLYTTPGYISERDAIASEALAYLEGNLGRFTEAGDKKPSEIYTRTVFDY